jgi:Animal haem peroxidase
MSSIQEAEQLMAGGKYQQVIELISTQLLPGESNVQPNADGIALLALAYFHSEEYELAVEKYELALKAEPGNKTWMEMLELSKTNVIGGVNIPVPDVYHFTREELLAKPVVPDGALPKIPPPLPPPGMFKKIRLFLGNLAGSVFSSIMSFLAKMVGSILGYRDKIWTNWYRRPVTLGILTLAYMREKLNKQNLISTYPKDSLVGFQPKGQTPPDGVTHYRTANGSWNNLQDPMEGAAGTRFARNVRFDAIKPETGEKLLTPNPREISRKLLTRNGDMKEVPFLNMLAACWIQFMNHDWVNHGENITTDLIEIPIAEDDPARKKYWQAKMFVRKTQPDPTSMPGVDTVPISFINEVTHWWDGSQIYGSDQQTINSLRSGIDGKLKMNADGTLPIGKHGVEETGFVRNWWIGLTLLHTVFTREHNAICDMLKAAHPEMDDNRLFNVARLINAAITAKIHSVEWTPAVLPNTGLDTALNANWYGILTNLFQSGTHRKTLSEINVRNPEMGGVVGNPINTHGVGYALTQEFVEVYRLHSLLPETIKIKRLGTDNGTEEIPFKHTRQAGSPKLTKRVPLADLFYSFGNQHPGQLVLNNYPKMLQELSIPGNPLYDMGAVDILRARERGVPRYNEFRRQLGMNPITSFDDLTDDKETVNKMRELYGDDVEMLDLMIGSLAEAQKNRPSGFGFGETMFQIFILNATRRLQADRFYTDCYNAETYTPEGLKWIDASDFKTVILRHYPELAATGLGNIMNAFEPWDTGAELDPNRHPLRTWDKRVKDNPWQGDAFRGATGG